MRCRRTELCMSNNAAERELRLAPQALSHDSSPFQTLRRPDGGEIIEFRHGLGARRQRHPGLLRRREYVDVWGASIGIIERANPHEADSGSGLRVIAPDCNLAGGAARDLLASSAGRWHIDDLRLARGVHDSIRLVEGVERVRCTGLALAPATVAGVDDERRAGQSIPDLAASASAFHGGPPTNGGVHDSASAFWSAPTRRANHRPGHLRAR